MAHERNTVKQSGIASLVCSIISILTGSPSTVSVLLVKVGGILMRVGRKIYQNGRKS